MACYAPTRKTSWNQCRMPSRSIHATSTSKRILTPSRYGLAVMLLFDGSRLSCESSSREQLLQQKKRNAQVHSLGKTKEVEEEEEEYLDPEHIPLYLDPPDDGTCCIAELPNETLLHIFTYLPTGKNFVVASTLSFSPNISPQAFWPEAWLYVARGGPSSMTIIYGSSR